MSATVVSAYAAVAAVVFGVVNVALAARLVRRQESHKQAWQHLPAVIEAFSDASFRFIKLRHLEVAGQGAGVMPVRDARAGRGRQSGV
ncbi:hypothetical protein [Streptomyces sp. NBC_00893]|uniref:hypothetical protein n=1 Tax=Streptomyces sp. NBC_00893 TaxID=2975862 RepID=UPI002254BFE9|nr:hypothetical protein [Streptomyces sp. NBC_00893]MCX4850411.1 hypothetical protein [Streptomyces sp. NBC_00893]